MVFYFSAAGAPPAPLFGNSTLAARSDRTCVQTHTNKFPLDRYLRRLSFSTSSPYYMAPLYYANV